MYVLCVCSKIRIITLLFWTPLNSMIQPGHESYGRFYRRPLPPDTCTDMSSDEGQSLFAGAFAAGYTRAFFPLISQFRTQDEPAFCGISTLVMVLNALAKDPGKVWKGVWRWWVEDMLDCCISLEEAKTSGITLDEFVCLAACQGLAIEKVVRPPAQDEEDNTQSATEDQSLYKTREHVENDLTAFRRDIALSCKSSDKFLVVSYDRKVLSQTGSGHFSPIGAFDQESDKVLILDVARFKYPPHWVQLELLWNAMRSLDKATHLPRGWVILTKPPQLPLLVKCAPLRSSCGCVQQIMHFVPQLLSGQSDCRPSTLVEIIRKLVKGISLGVCCSIESMLDLLKERGPPKIDAGERALDQWRSECLTILTELRSQSVYKEIGKLEIFEAARVVEADSSKDKRERKDPIIAHSERKIGDGHTVHNKIRVESHDRLALLILAILPVEVSLGTNEDSPLAKEVALVRSQLYAIHKLGEENEKNTKMACCSESN